MLNLSTNTELKDATFAQTQVPKVRFFWKDGDPVDEKEYSALVISANGTQEMEDFDGNLTKNTFSVELDNNNDTDLNAPGNWFPENSGSIGENVRVELGYEHAGAGSETVTFTRWKVRTLEGNTNEKKAQMTAVDEGKNLDYKINIGTLFKNKYPYEIITSVAGAVGYSTSNPVGSKKLIIKSLDVNPSVDESIFLVRYFAAYDDIGWDLVNTICEASLGKFFIDRNGDFNYWTYNYWASRFSSSNTSSDFVAKTWINDSTDFNSDIVPILETSIGVAYNNLVNSVDCNYFNFRKKENYNWNDITVELAPGESFVVEEDISSSYIETLDVPASWNKFAFLFDDYSGSDYGSDLTISNVVNGFKKITFTVTNSSATNFYYCKVQPRVILSWDSIQKITKRTENGSGATGDFSDGDYNYNLNKEKKKTISNVLVQSKEWSKQLTYTYIDLYRKPIRELNITTTWFPQMDLGDIVRALNYVEYKSTSVYGWIKKIDWSIDLDRGFLFSLVMNVMSSSSGLLVFSLIDYLDDLTKIDIPNTTAIVDSGTATARLGTAWFDEQFLNHQGLLDSFTSSVFVDATSTWNITNSGAYRAFKFWYDEQFWNKQGILDSFGWSGTDAANFSLIDSVNTTATNTKNWIKARTTKFVEIYI